MQMLLESVLSLDLVSVKYQIHTMFELRPFVPVPRIILARLRLSIRSLWRSTRRRRVDRSCRQIFSYSLVVYMHCYGGSWRVKALKREGIG